MWLYIGLTIFFRSKISSLILKSPLMFYELLENGKNAHLLLRIYQIKRINATSVNWWIVLRNPSACDEAKKNGNHFFLSHGETSHVHLLSKIPYLKKIGLVASGTQPQWSTWDVFPDKFGFDPSCSKFQGLR